MLKFELSNSSRCIATIFDPIFYRSKLGFLERNNKKGYSSLKDDSVLCFAARSTVFGINIYLVCFLKLAKAQKLSLHMHS